MSLETVEDIERAVGKLKPAELGRFAAWFEQFRPQTIDARIEADLDAGRFDELIQQAVDDHRNGRTTPL